MLAEGLAVVLCYVMSVEHLSRGQSCAAAPA